MRGLCEMAKIWITYDWDDNANGDVDYIAQELKQLAEIRLDRWNISAGKRLWEQIENFITSPEQSDAWLFVAKNNSLSSEACKEEFAYALDRALKIRGQQYPIIALFLGTCNQDLIPAGIRTRLYVSITDPDWKERIVAAAEGRLHQVHMHQMQPYYIHVHRDPKLPKPFIIEVRPRAGVWDPFIAAIPLVEKDIVNPHLLIGPRDMPTSHGFIIKYADDGPSSDGTLWLMCGSDQATPTRSYYINCKTLPSELSFGANGRSPQYTVVLKK